MNPLPTTTITVRRPSSSGDSTDAPDVAPIVSEYPATIGSPSGSDLLVGGEKETVEAVLIVSGIALQHLDFVDDESTGDTWAVVWARSRQGLGLDHVRAGLRRVTP